MQSDSAYLSADLVRYVPEAEPFIAELEKDEIELAAESDLEPTEINVYTLISEAFVHSVLLPALGDPPGAASLIERCAELIEILVTSPHSQIQDAAEIRIIEMVAGYNKYWRRFSPYAGPVTRSMILRRREED